MQERKASVQTSLQAIAKKASEQPGYRFRNLFGMLNEEMLRDSWHSIRKDAACGVDRISAKEYEQDLEGNIHKLVDELNWKSQDFQICSASNGNFFFPLNVWCEIDKRLTKKGNALKIRFAEDHLRRHSHDKYPVNMGHKYNHF